METGLSRCSHCGLAEILACRGFLNDSKQCKHIPTYTPFHANPFQHVPKGSVLCVTCQEAAFGKKRSHGTTWAFLPSLLSRGSDCGVSHGLRFVAALEAPASGGVGSKHPTAARTERRGGRGDAAAPGRERRAVRQGGR